MRLLANPSILSHHLLKTPPAVLNTSVGHIWDLDHLAKRRIPCLADSSHITPHQLRLRFHRSLPINMGSSPLPVSLQSKFQKSNTISRLRDFKGNLDMYVRCHYHCFYPSPLPRLTLPTAFETSSSFFFSSASYAVHFISFAVMASLARWLWQLAVSTNLPIGYS